MLAEGGAKEVGMFYHHNCIKVQESCSKWQGHVVRSEDAYVGKRLICREREGKEGRSWGGWTTASTT